MIDGGRGNDVLTGGAGSDTFVIATGNGNDIITDFQTGAGGDILQLNGTSFKITRRRHRRDEAGRAPMLSLRSASGETITLENSSIQNFTAANVNIVALPTGLIQTFNDDFNSLSAGQDPHLTWKTNYAWSGAASYSLDRRAGSLRRPQLFRAARAPSPQLPWGSIHSQYKTGILSSPPSRFRRATPPMSATTSFRRA